MENKLIKRQKGITLVALVVTIVVLLILVGITIMYVVGDNGIFPKAQNAKNKTEEAIKNEQEYMNQVDNIINGYASGAGNRGDTDIPTEESIESIKSDWEMIEKIAKEIAKDNTITRDTEKVTVIVDNKKYTITPGDIFEVAYEGEVKRVRVLGFKHDDLVEQTVYGGTHEKASISFEFLDFMTESTYKQMNTSNTNSGGWANTVMRAFLNGTEGKEKLSNKAYIKQVKKKYIRTYNSASSVTTCNDYLWLLASSEIVSSGYQEGAYGVAITSEGLQYEYYKTVNAIYNQANEKLVKKLIESGDAHSWWLRSPYYNSSADFCRVNNYGIVGDRNYASYGHGVIPGFCV